MINTVNYLQVYTDISKDPYESAAKDPTKALTGVKNMHFPDLKEWIQSYVTANKV